MLSPQWILILAAVLWGSSWLPLHAFAAQGIDGFPMVLASYGMIALVAVPLMLWQKARWWPQRWGVFGIALFGGWSNAALLSSLSLAEDPVRVMLLFYLTPVWALFGGCLLLGERLTVLRLLSLVLALAGIAMTLGVDRNTLSRMSVADWLALSASLGFALNNLTTRAADQVPLVTKTLAAFVGCSLFAALACWQVGVWWPPLPTQTWLWIAAFAFGWLLLATLGAQYGVSHLEAGRAAVLVVFELIAAVLTVAWFNEQPITAATWLGAVLITAAAVMAGWPERPQLALNRSEV
ncbi:MAG: multidrug DMT transporter permease [Pseudomonadales bacterium]|nr:multidrug DMT transporter permease [Pseudomonadales bacterium]MBP75508.1 multidrug DMT transporter permease [Pseudomonadales bacterium]HCB44303.1 multidrug DMT transporter permease [Pseudomonas sp.]HCL40307.1 multidrug DMT transporter permease [Pseudomonas sp.]|tara:strand:- start:769 stop:1650 length:882 start_codon:yes stop_codon:yes gene_type:complete